MYTNVVLQWPALDARCILAIGQATGNSEMIVHAQEIAFDLGVDAGIAWSHKELPLPGAMICGSGELLVEWCRGVAYVWEIRIENTAIEAGCECDSSVNYSCTNHADSPQHGYDAQKQMKQWLSVQKLDVEIADALRR